MFRCKAHLILCLLLLIHILLVGYGAAVCSPTVNEPGHLVAGLSHWEFGRFELYRVNPPLVRSVAALPVMAVGYEPDWDGFYESPGARPVFQMGKEFVQANGPRSAFLFTIARWACLPFGIVGMLTCFVWARDISGVRAGLLAAAFWSFSPSIIGSAHFITADAHASALGVLACFFFWKWLRNPTWRNVVISGLLLGAAELTKSTLIVFYPIWPFIWLIYRVIERRLLCRVIWTTEMPMLVVRMAIGLYVLNLGYAFEGSGQRLGEFEFVSRLFAGEKESPNEPSNRFRGTVLEKLPVPFPKNFLLGIDIQQRDFENLGKPSYLRGRFQDHGWWYYYLYVVMVKVPVGLLLLGTLAAVRVPWMRDIRKDVVVLAIIPAVIFIVVSSKTGFSQHARYILPCFPFTFILISVVLVHAKLDRLLKRVVAVCLSWLIASCVMTYPHTLSYFNEFSGGPFNGPQHLLNSNVDWGQDLFFVQRWLKKHPDKNSIALAYYGYFSPQDVGFHGVTPVTADSETIAISVNLFYGYPATARDGSEEPSYRVQPLPFDPKDYEISHAGYSMLILERKKL